MKKIELPVTDENLILTMEENIAKRNTDIKYFIELLDNIEGTMSIAINGDWGSGKTFFVKQAIMIMTYLNKELTFDDSSIDEKIEKLFLKYSNSFKELKPKTNLIPVYYNAWQSDNHNDPILSIIYTIIKKMGSNGNEKISTSDAEKLNSILNMISTPFISNIGSAVEAFQKKSCVQPIMDSEEITSILNSIIKEKVGEENKKIVMFIDELDRCNPQYAIKILERIKHFYDNENIIFIFSTNIEQLSKTISNYYGNGFASSRYLSKFFDLIIEIPVLDIDSFLFSHNIVENSNYYFDIMASYLAKQQKFSMRDCVRYLQLLEPIRKDAISDNSIGFNEDRGNKFMMIFFAPILLALKIKDVDKYIDFINGNSFEILNEIVSNDDMIKALLNRKLFEDKSTNDEKDNVLKSIYYELFKSSNEQGFANSKISINKRQVNDFLKRIGNLH
jgi:hypothetical protein